MFEVVVRTGRRSISLSSFLANPTVTTHCLGIKNTHNGRARCSTLIIAITHRNVKDQLHIGGVDQAAHSTCMTELAPLKMKMSQSVEGKANREVVLHVSRTKERTGE